MTDQARYEALKVQKLFEKQLAGMEEEIRLWEDREAKATAAGRADLVTAAQQKLTELREDAEAKRQKLLEAEALLRQTERDEKLGDGLTSADKAAIAAEQIKQMAGGEEEAARQETTESSEKGKAAAELERLKQGGAPDDDLKDL